MPPRPRFDLHKLRMDAQRFGRALPALAPALARAIPEPVTERLVDGVGYLASALLEKVEHVQQSAYDALAERASPWLRRPLPSATIIAFEPPSAGRRYVPEGALLESAPVQGVRCLFRTTRPLVVGAYRVAGARLDARPGEPPQVRLVIESTGEAPLHDVLAEGLTLYLGGELESALQIAHALASDVKSVSIESDAIGAPPILVPGAQIDRAGFGGKDSFAPDPDGLPSAFGVVTQSTLMPHAFRMIRIGGLHRVAELAPMRRATLTFTLGAPLSAAVTLPSGDVRAHCVLALNLFEAWAEPVALDPLRGAIPIRVSGFPRDAGGVYAVTEARARMQGGAGRDAVLPDLRRLAAARRDAQAGASFATKVRADDDGSPEMVIQFSRRGSAAEEPSPPVVSLRLLATNGALAGMLREGDIDGELEAQGGPIRARNLVATSPYVQPATGHAFALFATRHAALRDGGADPLGALKRVLFLAVPALANGLPIRQAANARVEALQSLDVSIAHSAEPEGGVRRGYAYRLLVDEAGFHGPGDLSLFGAALAAALARSIPVNTFVELTLVGSRGGATSTFRPRSDR